MYGLYKVAHVLPDDKGRDIQVLDYVAQFDSVLAAVNSVENTAKWVYDDKGIWRCMDGVHLVMERQD